MILFDLFESLLVEYDRAKTVETYGKKLAKAVYKDPSFNYDIDHNKISEEDFIKNFSNSDQSETVMYKLERLDPTPNKEYSQWLTRVYANDPDPYLSKVSTTLSQLLIKYSMAKKAKMFKGEQQAYGDINRFKTFKDFIDHIEPIKIPEKEQEKVQNKKEWVNNDNVRIIQPLDKTAAIHYGRGTQWCTAGFNSNMFDSYNNDGPLFIVIPKHPTYAGEKYQISFASEEARNPRDQAVDTDELFERFPEITKLPDYEYFYQDSDDNQYYEGDVAAYAMYDFDSDYLPRDEYGDIDIEDFLDDVVDYIFEYHMVDVIDDFLMDINGNDYYEYIDNSRYKILGNLIKQAIVDEDLDQDQLKNIVYFLDINTGTNDEFASNSIIEGISPKLVDHPYSTINLLSIVDLDLLSAIFDESSYKLIDDLGHQITDTPLIYFDPRYLPVDLDDVVLLHPEFDSLLDNSEQGIIKFMNDDDESSFYLVPEMTKLNGDPIDNDDPIIPYLPNLAEINLIPDNKLERYYDDDGKEVSDYDAKEPVDYDVNYDEDPERLFDPEYSEPDEYGDYALSPEEILMRKQEDPDYDEESSAPDYERNHGKTDAEIDKDIAAAKASQNTKPGPKEIDPQDQAINQLKKQKIDRIKAKEKQKIKENHNLSRLLFLAGIK